MFTIPRELEPSFHLSSEGQYNPAAAAIDATGGVAAAAVGDDIGGADADAGVSGGGVVDAAHTGPMLFVLLLLLLSALLLPLP